MSYTPPDGDTIEFSWVGKSAYSPPDGDAIEFSWAPSNPVAIIAVPGPLGVPGLVGNYPVVTGSVQIVVPGPLGGVAATGRVVAPVRVVVPGPLGVPATVGRVSAVGQIRIPGPLGAPLQVGTVLRYQLRGEVRLGGVLVDRRVRAYRRSDGALVAQDDTVTGAFSLDVGFSQDEYTILPVDMNSGATDYSPPAANRVLSVLAQG